MIYTISIDNNLTRDYWEGLKTPSTSRKTRMNSLLSSLLLLVLSLALLLSLSLLLLVVSLQHSGSYYSDLHYIIVCYIVVQQILSYHRTSCYCIYIYIYIYIYISQSFSLSLSICIYIYIHMYDTHVYNYTRKLFYYCVKSSPGRLPIKLNGHETSHPLELRVCLSQTL